MSVTAYSRSNPRYRRLYASKQICKEGYRKLKEEIIDGKKVLVYVQRRYSPAGLVPIREARIYPDGSVEKRELG